ncbi:MAG: ABC transporter permease [Steroidobacteraceae bacterium]
MNASVQRIWEMLRKEFRQMRRDPRMLRLLFISPLIQLILFGYAVSTDLHDASVYVVDQSRSQASRQLVDALTASGYFRVTSRSDRPVHLVTALDRGDALLGLAIPADFETRLSQGNAVVQILVDGTNSSSATIALGYAERIVMEFAARHSAGQRPSIELRDRAWFNSNLVSRDYNVPAVIGSIILLVCLLMTSLAIVREREIGTLEQLMVSPLTPFELIAGKTIPFALIGLIDVVAVTAVALIWFHIPFAGHFGWLLLASLLYLLAALGVGLLISTISSTQQEAFMTSFLVFMPLMLLSGFMFPVTSMPNVIQWLTLANPMRHFLEIVRAVFLKGAGFGDLWQQFAALSAMAVALLWFAGSRFRKTNK